MSGLRPAEHLTIAGLGVTRFPCGEPGAPVVVVVPGAMDRAAGFRRTVRHLDGIDVVGYDRRGYARSLDVTPSDRLAHHVDDLLAVVAGLDRPVVVAGHSQGALIALHAAWRVSQGSPEPISAVAAWEPPMPWFEWYDTTANPAIAAAFRGDAAPRELAERFMRSTVSDRLWERLPAAMREERLAEGEALAADIRASRHPEARLDLAAITVPVVVGAGTTSAPQHRRSAEVAAAGISGARLIEIPEAGHGAHLSHPLEFAAFVQAAVDITTR